MPRTQWPVFVRTGRRPPPPPRCLFIAEGSRARGQQAPPPAIRAHPQGLVPHPPPPPRAQRMRCPTNTSVRTVLSWNQISEAPGVGTEFIGCRTACPTTTCVRTIFFEDFIVRWTWGRGGGGGAPCHIQRSPNTPTTGLRERGNDTSKSTGRSGRQNAATRRNMRREERVTVQGPVKEQQPDGMSRRGGGGGLYLRVRRCRLQGCIGKGGCPPPPRSRAPSLCPATVPLTPSAGFNGFCNRQ